MMLRHPIPRRWIHGLAVLSATGWLAIVTLAQAAPQLAERVAASGQWLVEWRNDDGRVQLTFTWQRPGSGKHWEGRDIMLSAIDGLSRDQLQGPKRDVHFEIVRDAGTFVCDGRAGEGHGAGLFDLHLDQAFARTLEQRGVGAPSEPQQIQLALADAGLALLDELATQRYPTPDVNEFVRMAGHGVTTEYVRGMGRLGYRTDTVADLIQLRDHGVDPDFVEGMARYGHRQLTLDVLLRSRDHGVDPAYLRGMSAAGFQGLPLERLIAARDHGVDPDFIRAMNAAGYDRIALDELVRARDHGVDRGYVRGMAAAGYDHVPLDDLVRARDHGVDGAFAKSIQRRLGRSVSLSRLIQIRDQGGLD